MVGGLEPAPVFELADAYIAHLEDGGAEGVRAFLEARDAYSKEAAELLEMLAAVEGASGRLPQPGEAISHYRIIRRIGKGGMGVVFEAEDERLERRVAIKVCRRAMTSETGAQRFLREARALARLHHPNIVGVYDIGETEALLWYVMEYIAGPSLDRALASGEATPDIDVVLARFAELARALHTAHGLGIVHRDLKPANVLVAGPERFVLTDFGVAHWDSLAALTRTQDLPGTPAYMAPEQLGGAEPTPAIDQYGLAAVLYETLSGLWPPRTLSLADLYRTRSSRDLPALESLRPDVSPTLAAAVSRGLATRPEDRFADMEAFVRALEDVDTQVPLHAAPPQRIPVATTCAFGGREGPLATLAEASHALDTGKGGVVVIEGSFGVGRTRLLHAWLEGDARPLLYGRGRTDRPGSVLREALGTRLGPRAHEDLDVLLDGDATRIARMTAFLYEGVSGTPSKRWPPDALALAVTAACEAWSDESPLLLVLDDVEAGLDVETRRAVVALSELAQRRPVLLVAVLETPGSSASRELAVALRPNHRITLDPLDTDGVRAVLSATYGDAGLGARLTGPVHARTAGLPLLLSALVDTWDGPPPATGQTGGLLERVPQNVHEWLDARIAALSEDERTLLETGAVQGPRFEPALVARVLGRTNLAVIRTLAAVEKRTGLLVSAPGWIAFQIAPLRQRLLDGVPKLRRRALHASLASAAEEEARARGGAAATVAGAVSLFVTEHRLASGEPERALETATQAVQWLRRRHRPTEAVALADHATELAGGPDTARGFAFSVMAAEIAFDAGNLALARERIETLRPYLADTPDVARRVLLLRLEGSCLRHAGELPKAVEQLDAALEVAHEADLPLEVARIHSLLGACRLSVGEMEGARAHFQASLDAALRGQHERGIWVAHNNLGNVARHEGELGRAREHYDRAWRVARAADGDDVPPFLLSSRARIALLLGRFEEADRLARSLLDGATVQGDQRIAAMALESLMQLALRDGNLDRAAALARELIATREAIGDRFALCYSYLGEAEIHKARGDTEAQAAALDHARDLAQAVGVRPLIAIVTCQRAGAGLEEAGAAVEAVAAMAASMGRLDRIPTYETLHSATGDATWLERAWQDIEHVVAHAPASEAVTILDANPSWVRIRDRVQAKPGL